ncbi:MAG: non-homologous end-joining DNA ligase [Sporichthyaceae bacterium]
MEEAPRPMLATAGPLPGPAIEDRYAFEFKWDGFRTMVAVRAGGMRLWSRTAKDSTAMFPELAGIAGRVPADTILDGEVVAFDDAGRISFGALQRRGQGQRARIAWFGFDVLRLAGRDLTSLPWTERRDTLENLGLTGPSWQVPPYFPGAGADALEASAAARLEGVVAKLLTARYEPGRRSAAWIKVKHVATQSVVVGGWRLGRGGLTGGLGSLLVGIPDGPSLRYCGRVGTGFTQADRRTMLATLERLRSVENPFGASVPGLDARDAVWIRPELVGEVAFTEWTHDHRLRAPVWRGLRTDVDRAAIVREG